jgi:hypothetical protein
VSLTLSSAVLSPSQRSIPANAMAYGHINPRIAQRMNERYKKTQRLAATQAQRSIERKNKIIDDKVQDLTWLSYFADRSLPLWPYRVNRKVVEIVKSERTPPTPPLFSDNGKNLKWPWWAARAVGVGTLGLVSWNAFTPYSPSLFRHQVPGSVVRGSQRVTRDIARELGLAIHPQSYDLQRDDRSVAGALNQSEQYQLQRKAALQKVFTADALPGKASATKASGTLKNSSLFGGQQGLEAALSSPKSGKPSSSVLFNGPNGLNNALENGTVIKPPNQPLLPEKNVLGNPLKSGRIFEGKVNPPLRAVIGESTEKWGWKQTVGSAAGGGLLAWLFGGKRKKPSDS